MKHYIFVAGVALAILACSSSAYAATAEDDLLNAALPVLGSDSLEAELSYEPDDSIEDELDKAIDAVAGVAVKSQGETHKSEVAKAVADLLDTAKLDGTVGEQVRVLAQEQEDVHSKVAEKMEMIEGMDEWDIFLWGPDHTALGELRSALVTSESGLEVLKLAQSKAHATLQDDIEVQIKAIESENARARVFIDEHEDVFSLFGWFFKLF